MLRRCVLPFCILAGLILPLLTPAENLPWDPDVVRGRLDNGLHFLIRSNPKPSDRVELRLVVNAGSVLEDDDQQGLAHFLEHMAFNGTEQFAKQELVNYLESIGMRFGPDLNAYTSFDQTVYLLQVRTDKAEQVDQAFLILREWASAVANEGEEIDKERGVILEERRLRRGARQRIRDQQLPVLFQGSKYAERLPIGTEEVLTSFTHDRLRAFYQTWYRPDLMAVVAVGDLDAEALEALIRKHFGTLPAVEKPVERPEHPMPAHEETLVSVAVDAEETSTSVSLYHKLGPEAFKSVEDFRVSLVNQLVNGMLNQRLAERSREQDAPFLGAYAHKGGFVRGVSSYVLSVEAREGESERGFKALMEEAERARQHGFTATELGRVKQEILRGAERAYQEKDTTPSRHFADTYIQAFLEDRVSVSPEFNWKRTEALLPEITLEQIHQALASWMKPTNRVLLASAPEKKDLTAPDGPALLALVEASREFAVEPYVDNVSNEPLVADPGPAGTITKRSTIEELGLTRWELSNGAVVLFKATEFKKDQILLSAWSRGGDSKIAVEQLIPGRTATEVVGECGLGTFSRIQLSKKLSGKIASVTPYIQELEEGLGGACSPTDLDILFQLVHLNFTAAREDAEAFSALQSRAREHQKNRLLDPLEQYGDMVTRTMSRDHPRRQPMDVAGVARYDMQKSLALFRDRFPGPGDFTFLLVGAIDPAKLEQGVNRYLGSLPAGREKETWVNPGIAFPPGEVTRTLHKGVEPKSRVEMVYSGPMKTKLADRHLLQSLTQAMAIRLREVLREDLGGTYSIGVYPVFKPFPNPEYRLVISFSCDPERVDELLAAAKAQVEVFISERLDDEYLQKVVESQLRRLETEKEQNAFWLRSIKSHLWLDESPLAIERYEKLTEKLSARKLQKAAKQYLGTPNRALFILKPENPAGDEKDRADDA